MNQKFRAVTRSQLIEILGSQCSPMARKDGYVIGPDIFGRICHIASCDTLGEAQKRAEEMNKREGNK